MMATAKMSVSAEAALPASLAIIDGVFKSLTRLSHLGVLRSGSSGPEQGPESRRILGKHVKVGSLFAALSPIIEVAARG